MGVSSAFHILHLYYSICVGKIVNSLLKFQNFCILHKTGGIFVQKRKNRISAILSYFLFACHLHTLRQNVGGEVTGVAGAVLLDLVSDSGDLL